MASSALHGALRETKEQTMKRYIPLLALIVALGGLLGAAPARAAQRTRCFPETGHCVSGAILAYWEGNGGLTVFGYPLNDLQVETNEGWTGPTQWFERDRLEDHGRIGVLAGRLGAQILELQGRPWQSFPRVGNAPSDCRYFAQTGHSLCGIFLSYWLKHGGLERFGYPVTEQIEELLGAVPGTAAHPYQVQYFERRRMEYHSELSNTPYEVLLGLLGRDIYVNGGCQQADPPLGTTATAYRSSIGCPTWSFPSRPEGVRAVEPFERGTMVWVKGGYRLPNRIYVIYFDNARGSLVWESYEDTWYEGEPSSGGEKPPSGLYEPIRGFGKLWRTNPHVRNTLGWAAAPESADGGSVQTFDSGSLMLYRATSDRVFILYADGRADDIMRIP
jgi:hypothetical protein